MPPVNSRIYYRRRSGSPGAHSRGRLNQPSPNALQHFSLFYQNISPMANSFFKNLRRFFLYCFERLIRNNGLMSFSIEMLSREVIIFHLRAASIDLCLSNVFAHIIPPQ